MRLHYLPAFLAAALTAGVLSGCALQVHTDANAGLISQVSCHTFAFAGSFQGNSPLRGSIANPVNEQRLRAAITGRMQASGAQLVESQPQCLVGYGIGSRHVIDGVYPGWGWGYYGAWWGGPPLVYQESYVTVDLFDARSRQAIWHAAVEQDLHHTNGAEADKRIHAAVDALFAKFPVRTS